MSVGSLPILHHGGRMDHRTIDADNVADNIAERYVTGRLSPAEAADFEEHFLDCPACCYAVAQIVYQKPGVKQARADFKTGLLTAIVEKEKFDRMAAEEALKQQGVLLKSP